MLLRGLNVKADMGSVPEFARVSINGGWWLENVPKMSRNRGNVIDLLTGKISATIPPPPTECGREVTKMYRVAPPKKKIMATPLPPHVISY